ncbi:MAG: Sulfate transporter [Candidatus Falkowbacteria bacterium GW2011_GWC2_38_22]|uniref:Sulfate transporter n=1 Tax=Candidatus Falkowbacteria bacterium GW2011_GWE1_38_31 TaxID=1618638 RepID=A0A0G0JQE8_9BACT|nr:MAG: Sulfate transporter [Candidatus Falkowbacteria bacterium GW2011_GWF2_38_1205]KKQ60883.1 MAG: Sulfate transporter [Candidatus Falkowbacteria bacterium GW2011_GWC2_38_22]KKQ63001.1 MAG: Sulfate transporter [Candidatus Falkowbacteria bacterium GW2011_GWF1_38_22]KKQ65023.1 MAG: Sulfate transporter [Candidatus Falkowbacteria bacterium GW2011_GWE2_38_254]KKQ69798.1 MAG: Sulfate transporter [Candidatus Falkowbacteria bacterium GW2011_GWE1_38_31]KKQ72380.1 MAG: Sulfate transporter [Candidatus 
MISKIKSFSLKNYLPILDDVKTYNFFKLKADLISGMTVGIVGLPQSMAYAMIAGVHPKYGLYAAIVPSIVASFFGASKYLAAGPTNAISMLLSSSLASVFVAGIAVSDLAEMEKMGMIFLLSFMVGVLQFSMGLLKFGNLLRFVSHSVVIGFTAGAAVLIAFNQIKNLIGVNIGNHHEFIAVMKHTILAIPEANFYAIGLGLFTIAFVIIAKKISKKIPGPLLALVFSAFFVFALKLESYGVKTIGVIPQSLPPFSHFPLNFENFRALFMPALAIAILGIVEALSMVKSVAAKTGEKIQPDQEFIAQGLANMSAGFFSGIPGSGSFTRSAVNFSSGAKSRFSVIMSGLFILLVLLIAAPLAKYIPTASLAGILIIIAYGMVDYKGIKKAIITTKSDRMVIIITLIATLLLELDKAVYVGVFVSILLFVKNVSSPEVYKMMPDNGNARLMQAKPGCKDCRQLSIYQVEGSLFFGAIDDMEKRLHSFDLDHDNCIIIRMKQVQMVDATAIHALENFLEDCKKRKTRVIFANIKPEVLATFKRSGFIDRIDKDGIADNTTAAIAIFFEKYCDAKICATCPVRLWKECPGQKNGTSV